MQTHSQRASKAKRHDRFIKRYPSEHPAAKDGKYRNRFYLFSWYDCPECHEEANPDHQLLYIFINGMLILSKSTDMCFACKKCKKVFRKDVR